MPTPESILMMTRGFMESRILLTAAELDLFTLVSHEPMSAEEVTAGLKSDLRATTILLDALASMELLEKHDGRYNCPKTLAPFVVSGSPASVMPMVIHAVGLWRRWSCLTDIVKTGSPDVAPASFDEPGQMAAFIGAMHVVGSRLAQQMVKDMRPGNARKLLDIGGASGTYTQAFLEACPCMCAALFDRPEVVEMARQRLGECGLLDRVALVPGDFYTDEFPKGFDLALLSAIIHQNSPQQNIELYKRIFRSLDPGGRVVIRDHVMRADHIHPPSGAVFAVNMLVATPGGNTYTFDEIRGTLEAAGFERVALMKQDERMDGLIEAFKPRQT
jgi:SAM-dependent methyltransferase